MKAPVEQRHIAIKQRVAKGHYHKNTLGANPGLRSKKREEEAKKVSLKYEYKGIKGKKSTGNFTNIDETKKYICINFLNKA